MTVYGEGKKSYTVSRMYFYIFFFFTRDKTNVSLQWIKENKQPCRWIGVRGPFEDVESIELYIAVIAMTVMGGVETLDRVYTWQTTVSAKMPKNVSFPSLLFSP